jgi:hypothetical protein
MTKGYQGSGDPLKSLYEALGEVQAELSDLGLNDWNQDYRGWKYDPECECTRCELVRKFW